MSLSHPWGNRGVPNYNFLDTPMEAVGESIQAMKPIAIALLSAEDAGEVGGYFDYLIQRVSEKS